MASSIPWVWPVRGVQVIFGIIVLGLIAYVVSFFNGNATVNFMLFNGIWTAFIATPFLAVAPIYLPNLAHRFIILGVDAITMIFWFAGFIALAAELPSARICRGPVCNSAQAAVAFGAFDWALFAVTTGVSVNELLRGNSSKPAQPTAVGV